MSQVKRRGNIRSRSPKKSKQMREASQQIARLIFERGPECQLEAIIKSFDPDYSDCMHHIQGRHHLRKQSAQGNDSDENVLLSCNPCNDWPEANPDDAHEIGLVVRAGDELWDQLGPPIL